MIMFIVRMDQSPLVTEVLRRYKVLRDNCEGKFQRLKNPVIITFFKQGLVYKSLGYNVNKGEEIGICVDGTPNDIFHVLLHELAHSTVAEYSHNEEFWNNFSELCQHCIKLGIYEKTEKTKFCGGTISDN